MVGFRRLGRNRGCFWERDPRDRGGLDGGGLDLDRSVRFSFFFFFPSLFLFSFDKTHLDLG